MDSVQDSLTICTPPLYKSIKYTEVKYTTVKCTVKKYISIRYITSKKTVARHISKIVQKSRPSFVSFNAVQ